MTLTGISWHESQEYGSFSVCIHIQLKKIACLKMQIQKLPKNMDSNQSIFAYIISYITIVKMQIQKLTRIWFLFNIDLFYFNCLSTFYMLFKAENIFCIERIHFLWANTLKSLWRKFFFRYRSLYLIHSYRRDEFVLFQRVMCIS